MKKSFLVLYLFFSFCGFSFGQTNEIPKNIQTLFEGKWSIIKQSYINTVEIKFEKNKNYAIFTDIGTGEAPPLVLKAYVQGNKLIIPAEAHKNDYAEMTIKNNTLVFFTTPAIEKTNKKNSRTLIFKRAK